MYMNSIVHDPVIDIKNKVGLKLFFTIGLMLTV